MAILHPAAVQQQQQRMTISSRNSGASQRAAHPSCMPTMRCFTCQKALNLMLKLPVVPLLARRRRRRLARCRRLAPTLLLPCKRLPSPRLPLRRSTNRTLHLLLATAARRCRLARSRMRVRRPAPPALL